MGDTLLGGREWTTVNLINGWVHDDYCPVQYRVRWDGEALDWRGQGAPADPPPGGEVDYSFPFCKLPLSLERFFDQTATYPAYSGDGAWEFTIDDEGYCYLSKL